MEETLRRRGAGRLIACNRELIGTVLHRWPREERDAQATGKTRGIVKNDQEELARLRREHAVADPQLAVSLGLVVNELVTNSLKHAFPDNHAGTVNVVLR